MIALFALVVLFMLVAPYLYIVRVRRELEAVINQLARRIDAMERLQSARVMRPPAPAVTAPVVEAPAPSYEPDTAAEERPDTLETEIGSRWLLYVGVLALVVGAAYFQKLAIDNEWIGERARVIEGIVAGLALVAGGRWFIRRGYDVYGQIVAGGGVAVLYVSVYAAATLYELIGRSAAFAALCAVTSLAAFLADRYRSQSLAVMAVGGGFLTPFLLPSDQDAQVALFTYDGVLIAGTMYLSHRRVWPLLNVVSYAFTQLTVIAWAAANYTSAKYLVTEAYLSIFCGMFLYILHEIRRSDAPGAIAAQAVLWTAPVLYYVASLAVLRPHSVPLLLFLGGVATIGTALTPRGYALIRLTLWIAAAFPLLDWATTHDDADWLATGLIAVTGVYVIHLLGQLYTALRTERPAGADVALLHLNPLLAYVTAHVLVSGAVPERTAALAFGFALWNLVVAGALWSNRRDPALHFSALAGTFLAIAIGLEFDGAARTIGWGCEGAAAAWLGLRQKRLWFYGAGLGTLTVAIVQLVFLLLSRLPDGYAILANSRTACGLLIVTLLYVLAWIHRVKHHDGLSPTPFVLTANVVTLLLLTTEISAYWQLRELVEPGSAGHLGRELMLSVSWALYATALIVIGLRGSYAPIRYLAMAVFGVTIVKVFFRDLAELEQIYRVSSIIALGVLLLLTSYLYNRSQRHGPA